MAWLAHFALLRPNLVQKMEKPPPGWLFALIVYFHFSELMELGCQVFAGFFLAVPI
jgi:hypothetical protein